MIVDAIKTPASAATTARALALAWFRLWGVMPSHVQLCVLLAQWAQECRRGDAVYNWNFANQKALGTYDGDSCYRACNEWLSPEQAAAAVARARKRTDGLGLGLDVRITDETDDDGRVLVWFYPSSPAARFRTYATIEEGALAYLDLLFNKFESAWSFVLAGDARGFAKRLGELGFYTADSDVYAAGLDSLAREYSHLELDLSPPAVDIAGRLAADQDASLRMAFKLEDPS